MVDRSRDSETGLEIRELQIASTREDVLRGSLPWLGRLHFGCGASKIKADSPVSAATCAFNSREAFKSNPWILSHDEKQLVNTSVRDTPGAAMPAVGLVQSGCGNARSLLISPADSDSSRKAQSGAKFDRFD